MTYVNKVCAPEQLQRQLDQSSAELRHVDEEIEDARIQASELSVLQEKLKGLAEATGPDAVPINKAHAAKGLRAREQKVPDIVVNVVSLGISMTLSVPSVGGLI